MSSDPRCRSWHHWFLRASRAWGARERDARSARRNSERSEYSRTVGGRPKHTLKMFALAPVVRSCVRHVHVHVHVRMHMYMCMCMCMLCVCGSGRRAASCLEPSAKISLDHPRLSPATLGLPPRPELGHAGATRHPELGPTTLMRPAPWVAVVSLSLRSGRRPTALGQPPADGSEAPV